MWTTGQRRGLGLRTRKLLGTLMLLALISVYALVVMGAVASVFPQISTTIYAALFYFVAGVAWVPLAMPIISWMSRPDPTDAPDQR